MKRENTLSRICFSILSVAFLTVFIFGGSSHGATTHKGQFSDKLVLKQFLQQQPAYPENFVGVHGVAGANADINSKKVWATAIGKGAAEAGFKSITLRNTGTIPWPGITVTVSANVLKTIGGAKLIIYIYKDGNVLPGTGGVKVLASPGDGTLTSGTFTMEPGHDYHAVGFIQVSPAPDEIQGVVGIITDIKWNI